MRPRPRPSDRLGPWEPRTSPSKPSDWPSPPACRPCLWGAPGTGKTSAIKAMADAAGLPCETVIAAIREPSDFSGLPVIVDGVVRFAPPRWAERLAEAGRGLLFLDEISTAPPAVQAALLRVVLERVVGDLELPEGIVVVAAANPPELAADGWDLTRAARQPLLPPRLDGRRHGVRAGHRRRVAGAGRPRPAGDVGAAPAAGTRPHLGLHQRAPGAHPRRAGRRRRCRSRLAVAPDVGDGGPPLDGGRRRGRVLRGARRRSSAAPSATPPRCSSSRGSWRWTCPIPKPSSPTPRAWSSPTAATRRTPCSARSPPPSPPTRRSSGGTPDGRCSPGPASGRPTSPPSPRASSPQCRPDGAPAPPEVKIFAPLLRDAGLLS